MNELRSLADAIVAATGESAERAIMLADALTEDERLRLRCNLKSRQLVAQVANQARRRVTLPKPSPEMTVAAAEPDHEAEAEQPAAEPQAEAEVAAAEPQAEAEVAAAEPQAEAEQPAAGPQAE